MLTLRKAKVSQEQVLKTLIDFGLTPTDASIYVFLAKKGSQKGLYIRNALKLSKEQLYSSLKEMKAKGIISSTIEHPARFSALPFEKVLDLFIKTKMEETRRLQKNKEEILSNWNELGLAENELTPKFTVIEGRNYVYTKIQQMIQEAKNCVLAITTVPSLMQADQRGLFDVGFSNPLKSKIQFRFLAELSQQNVKVMKALFKETIKTKLNVEGRSPDLGLRLFPQMVIRDDEEALFFIRSRSETSIVEHDEMCLWTDCKSLVDAFSVVFEDFWHNSTDILMKIAEIETGRPAPKTLVIGDPETAKRKYSETMQAAKEEILIVTSPKGVIELWEDISKLTEWSKKGVSIKVMAPVNSDNIDATEQLSKVCTVRHVPPHYLNATIVDGKHLFQFKTPNLEKQPFELTSHFENTFYTNDVEYVEKTRTMLKETWKNARAPSLDTLKSIIGPYGSSLAAVYTNPYKKVSGVTVLDEQLETITEKDVLNKIIIAKKIPVKDPEIDVLRLYGSQGIAITHPPDGFKLPDMMLFALHVDKQTSFGAEDVLIVALWLEIPKGRAYVPVAFAGDNSKSLPVWKSLLAATPAAQNMQLFKKDELQVWVHGNTLFAGWAVTIPLFPQEYSLPPACFLVEGYGDVKTARYVVIPPSGHRHTVEQNYFDAFVTFMHPKSKYSGPGTDGLFIRDYLVTVTPPLTKL
jgi:sugar-specific transcriptional regulator TrmB